MSSKPGHPRVRSAAVSQDGRRRRCGATAARWTSQPSQSEVESATPGRLVDTVGVEERQQVDEERRIVGRPQVTVQIEHGERTPAWGLLMRRLLSPALGQGTEFPLEFAQGDGDRDG